MTQKALFAEGSFIGFDKNVLELEEWQTVLKFLDRHKAGDAHYSIGKEKFTSPKQALELLIRWFFYVVIVVILEILLNLNC